MTYDYLNPENARYHIHFMRMLEFPDEGFIEMCSTELEEIIASEYILY